MNELTLAGYSEFILLKAAPSTSIGQTKFHLLHCGLGIATELMEALQSNSRENTQEELGDFLWYLTLLKETLGVSNSAYLEMLQEPEGKTNSNTLFWDILTHQTEEMCSLIKKHCIYGSHKLEEIQEQFETLVHTFVVTSLACNNPIGLLITTNMEKLDKRYKESFSQEESEERKDKVV